jgi:hypothetical protein
MTNKDMPHVTAEDRHELAATLGVSGDTSSESLTVDEIRKTIDAKTDPEFASMGESIRNDLTGKLDADLLFEELSNTMTQINRLPEIREVGIPEGKQEPDELYRELIKPGWRMYEHLVDVGFFESIEANLPRFTPEHIEHTANELIQTETLTAALTECGFNEHEKTVLMMNVVNNNTRLARWVPTREIPEGVEFNVEHVPPLHQRAAGGSLLWIDALDTHLWQKRVLISEDILDDGYWHIKAMLGGLYVMTAAAREIARDDSSFTDAQLTAALTASAAMMIVNQEEIRKDMFWITEEMRAPSKVR